MKSSHIHGWSALKPYGINCLTGESCAFSMRLLCDLSEAGCALVREFLGLSCLPASTDTFAKNWNSSVGDVPAIASIMLPRGLYDDLCRFILFSIEHVDIALKQPDGGWCGYSGLEENMKTMMRTLCDKDGWSMYHNPRAGDYAGSRNLHAFSNRTE